MAGDANGIVRYPKITVI